MMESVSRHHRHHPNRHRHDHAIWGVMAFMLFIVFWMMFM